MTLNDYDLKKIKNALIFDCRNILNSFDNMSSSATIQHYSQPQIIEQLLNVISFTSIDEMIYNSQNTNSTLPNPHYKDNFDFNNEIEDFIKINFCVNEINLSGQLYQYNFEQTNMAYKSVIFNNT